MARHRNPLSDRNRNATFTGNEVRKVVERLAASKRARVVRERGEFSAPDLRRYVTGPWVSPAAYSWAIPDIVSAREQQLVGRFRLPARLAESMGTDPAIFTARSVRLAPVQSLSVELIAGRGPRADRIADEAEALFGEQGIAISSETVTTIRSHLTDHGVAFGVINRTPRADGARIDYVMSAWPIEFVWWHEYQKCWFTQARIYDDVLPDPQAGGLYSPSTPHFGIQPMVPIIHGNGRWVVFAKSELLPHRLDAALLPAALTWATHAFANRDWSRGSATHGNPKVVGELPEGTALSDEEGNLTREAVKFLGLLQGVASQESPVGIRPSGSKMDYITNPSRAWEVWKELSESAERAAARIYLGTDGVLGAQGGAPGVDVQALFGVATSKVQSDLAAIQKGIQTGVIAPWCAENFGDDKQSPDRRYRFPDPDEAQVREDFAKRNAAFNADVKAYRENGFVVDQPLIDRLAAAHGVPAPTLPTSPSAASDSAATSAA